MGYYMEDAFEMAGVWMILAFALAIGGAIALYCTFLRKDNDGKFKGFLGWLYDFLTFKNMLLEMILRVVYLVLAIHITLTSLSFLGINFLLFVMYLVFGNLILRVTFEFSLVLLTICRNTSEINKKMSKK